MLRARITLPHFSVSQRRARKNLAAEFYVSSVDWAYLYAKCWRGGPNSPELTALLQMGGRIDGRGHAAIRSVQALSLIVLSP